jgi:predicted AlkP superfamily pyrophosphatase or phosphodiesterase
MKQIVMKDRANAGNFPKNVVMVVMSGLNYESIKENIEFKEFLDFLVHKENAARVFELQNNEFSETVPNWISLFTGTMCDIHGTPGNTFSEGIVKVDNIFRRMKENQIDNFVIGSSDLNNFLRKSIPDAEFLESDTMSKRFDDVKLIKYSDEIRYQNFIKAIDKKQKGYQYNKHLNITYDERITKDQYYINYFAMVHFSNNTLT